jgi:hypothetical protein
MSKLHVRPVHVLTGLLILLTVVGSIVAYNALPDMIPQIAGRTGRPGELVPKTWSRFVFLWPITLALIALFNWVAARLPYHPEWFKQPDRSRLARLSLSERKQAVHPGCEALRWIGFSVAGVEFIRQGGAFAEALGVNSDLIAVVVIPLIFVVLFITVAKARDKRQNRLGQCQNFWLN